MRKGKEGEIEGMRNSRRVKLCVHQVFLKSRMVQEVQEEMLRDTMRLIMLTSL